MLWCWPTFCAPTGSGTDRCRRTASSFGPSWCWRAPTRTPPGGAPGPSKSCVPCCEYYPGFLAAFTEKDQTNLASADARAVLPTAPTPADGARLTRPRITAALRRGGRQRNIEAVTDHVQRVLRNPQLHHPALVEQAMGQQALTLLAMLNAACEGAEQLGRATAATFRQHPDYGIVTSFPALGELTGARVLAEIGDDRTWFADARSLRAYVGSAPVTRASGRSHIVTH